MTTVFGICIDGLLEAGPLAALVVQGYGLGGIVLLKLGILGGSFLVWKTVPRPASVGIPLGLAITGVLVTAWNAYLIVLVVL